MGGGRWKGRVVEVVGPTAIASFLRLLKVVEMDKVTVRAS
jgi:hypothetical protein